MSLIVIDWRHCQSLPSLLLRLCSGILTVCSVMLTLRSGQVKAAVAHVRRLKRNQRKKKLTLGPRVLSINFLSLRLCFRLVSLPLLLRPNCDSWRKGMIYQGQDIRNRHKTKLSRNCLGGIILKVEAFSLLCSTA
jgi:hypothetical protein